MQESVLENMAHLFLKYEIDGLIATNTTVSRDGLTGCAHASEVGGLSGKPLENQATFVLQKLSDCCEGKIPLIGVGGIDSAKSAYNKIMAGATLVQVYTGFIYQGPAVLKEIAQGAVTGLIEKKQL